MILLYLLGVGVAWLFDPQRRKERKAGQAGSEVAKTEDSR
jgi:hypothetical protein